MKNNHKNQQLTFPRVQLTVAPYMLIAPKFYSETYKKLDVVSEYVLAEALTDLPEFISKIKAARDVIGLKKLLRLNIKLDEKDRPKKVLSFLKRNDGFVNPVAFQIHSVLKAIPLGNHWYVPIAVAIFTNKLPVPIPDVGVQLADSIQTTSGLRTIQPETQMPALIFSRQVKKKNLIEWVDFHWLEITKALKNLPKPQMQFRISNEQLRLGKVIYILRHMGLSWEEIDNWYTKFTNEIPDDIEVDSLLGNPSYIDFKRAYVTYLKVLQNFLFQQAK